MKTVPTFDLNHTYSDGRSKTPYPITVKNLIQGYKNGFFPWPEGPKDLIPSWHNPLVRGLLPTKEFYCSRSLKRELNKKRYQVTLNTDFEEIIHLCQSFKRADAKTWISPKIIEGYTKLYERSLSYAVSVRDEDGNIVGGHYGVCLGDYISAESSFHLATNASKVGLYYFSKLCASLEIYLIDIQMVTPLSESLGGFYVRRNDFMEYIYHLSNEDRMKTHPFQNIPHDLTQYIELPTKRNSGLRK